MASQPDRQQSMLTIGGYDTDLDRIYKGRFMSYDRGYRLNAHRIAGSFHWEIKLNAFKFKGSECNKNIPKRVFMDTGTNGILMPAEAWLAFYELVCNKLPVGQCKGTYPNLLIESCVVETLPPVIFKLDSVDYELPFSFLFQQGFG